MDTIQPDLTVDPQEEADYEAACRHFAEGTPFEPDLAQRIRKRADESREAVFKRVGYIDVNKLIHESRDEE